MSSLGLFRPKSGSQAPKRGFADVCQIRKVQGFRNPEPLFRPHRVSGPGCGFQCVTLRHCFVLIKCTRSVQCVYSQGKPLDRQLAAIIVPLVRQRHPFSRSTSGQRAGCRNLQIFENPGACYVSRDSVGLNSPNRMSDVNFGTRVRDLPVKPHIPISV